MIVAFIKIGTYDPNNKLRLQLSDDTWTKLTYPEYLQLVEKVSRGFIALGLEESHSVGVMANNCVEWTTASHAAIFAGGLICGIYQTSSPDIVSHLAKMSDMDILVVENLAMLKKAIGTRSSLKEALPSVKVCVMIEAPTKELNDGKHCYCSKLLEKFS